MIIFINKIKNINHDALFNYLLVYLYLIVSRYLKDIQ